MLYPSLDLDLTSSLVELFRRLPVDSRQSRPLPVDSSQSRRIPVDSRQSRRIPVDSRDVLIEKNMADFHFQHNFSLLYLTFRSDPSSE